VPSGSYIFLVEGSPVPSGYTFVGGFSQVVQSGARGRDHHQEVYFNIYRKN